MIDYRGKKRACWLNSELAWRQTALALVQARAARYADTVALFQALGGGWWHRQDVANVASSEGEHPAH